MTALSRTVRWRLASALTGRRSWVDFFHAYRSTPAGNCQDIDPVGDRNSDVGDISVQLMVFAGRLGSSSRYLVSGFGY